MKTFKEFSINITPRGHRIVKVMNISNNEIMITKNKMNKYSIMYDNQIVDTVDNEKDAMKAAQNFGKVLSKGILGKSGVNTSKLLKNKKGPSIPWAGRKKV